MIGFSPSQSSRMALFCRFCHEIMRDGASCQEHCGNALQSAAGTTGLLMVTASVADGHRRLQLKGLNPLLSFQNGVNNDHLKWSCSEMKNRYSSKIISTVVSRACDLLKNRKITNTKQTQPQKRRVNEETIRLLVRLSRNFFE